MITSLLEPCLIIPNYAARHLVLSVSHTMPPEQQLVCCSVCVQSPWYHQWACSPILAGYNAETYAVVFNNTAWYCPGGSLLCVFCPSLFSPICHAVYPNMERGAFQALHVADAPTHRDDLHSSGEKSTLNATEVKVHMLTNEKLFVLVSVFFTYPVSENVIFKSREIFIYEWLLEQVLSVSLVEVDFSDICLSFFQTFCPEMWW